MSDIIDLAERMARAFSRYNCFIFEENELEKVRDLVIAAELKGLVEVKQVDPRYPYIYIVTPWTRSLEKDCVSRVNIMLTEGRLTQEEYKKYRANLIEQCMVSGEVEVSKRIVEALTRHINKLKSSSNERKNP
ncbi:MAG: hypothetical protein ACP5N5_05715 [Desulfurococcus sp.]|uniref:hypothetical protein n=1 Tax=Desulfurococcus sp. TaxID=51678 RepID=UPI003D126CEA